MGSQIASTLIGTLIGGVISAVTTWLVARAYYEKAGRELREETTKVRKKVDMVLHGFEVAGLAELNRDANGEIVGFHVYGDITLALSGVEVKGEAGNISPKKGRTEGTD
jgi:hypothetical protein